MSDLESLSYNVLRKLAKKYGINAKQKAVALRCALKEALEKNQSNLKNSAFCEDNVSSTICIPESVAESSLIPHTNEYEKNDPSPCPWAADSRASRSIQSVETTKSPSETNLNTTYELESPKVASKSDTSRRTSDVIERDSENFSRISQQNTARQRPKVTRFAARSVPNFSRIHARAASKMESLPQFMQRRQALRPPFASPPYPSSQCTARNPNVCTGKVVQALSDLSNRPSHQRSANLAKHDSVKEKLTPSDVPKSHFTFRLHGTNPKQPPVVYKYTPKIPANSAFARRKAYDLKHNLARVSSHLPGRLSGVNDAPAKPVTSTHTPTCSTPEKRSSMTTVPRRDPRDLRPCSSASAQREKSANILQQSRVKSRRALADARRAL